MIIQSKGDTPYVLTYESYEFNAWENTLVDSTFTLVNRIFIDCTFTRCDFRPFELTNTKFINCTLIDCDLYHADLRYVDLRFSKVTGKTRLPHEYISNYYLPKSSTFILAQPVSIIIHNRECIQIEDEVRTYEEWLELTESYWVGQYGGDSSRVKTLMSYVRRTLNFYLEGK